MTYPMRFLPGLFFFFQATTFAMTVGCVGEEASSPLPCGAEGSTCEGIEVPLPEQTSIPARDAALVCPSDELRSPRCDLSREDVSWAPSSYLTHVSILSYDAEVRDFDGDGEGDNSIGHTHEALSGLFMVDSEHEVIERSKFAVVWEHEGVEADPARYTLNSYVSRAQDSDHRSFIYSGSFAQGLQPWVSHPASRYANQELQITGGSVLVPVVMLGVLVSVLVEDVELESQMVIDDGVVLSEGLGSGLVRYEEFIRGVNRSYEIECDNMLDQRPDLIVIEDEHYRCSRDFRDVNDERISVSPSCHRIISHCSGLLSIAEVSLDINKEAPSSDCAVEETCDAGTIAFKFSARRAEIAGFHD